MMSRPLAVAHSLALAVPVALLGGALAFQYVGGLVPCEMCIWQRWPHGIAIVLAALALFVPAAPPRKLLIALAALAIMTSGAIGVYHWGVEQHIFRGLTTCSASAAGGSTADIMADILKTPLVRCDQPQWSLFGISMAGWNAIFSLGFGGVILWLTTKR